MRRCRYEYSSRCRHCKGGCCSLDRRKNAENPWWVIAAILSPLIVLVVLLCAFLSSFSDHNVTAVELCFHGGVISANVPEEYRIHIEEMRSSFDRIDDAVSEINAMCEDGQSLEDTRSKPSFILCTSPQTSPLPQTLPPTQTALLTMRREPEQSLPSMRRAAKWRWKKPILWPSRLQI